MKSLADLQAFSRSSQTSLALDETLDAIFRESSIPEAAFEALEEVVVSSNVAALIVKPSLLKWGPSFAVKIARFASGIYRAYESRPALKVTSWPEESHQPISSHCRTRSSAAIARQLC